MFEQRPVGQAPGGSYAFVGCELKDGSYVGGRLAWYSTEVVENGDRDLVLAPPLHYRLAGGPDQELVDVERVILAARDISRLDVSYVTITLPDITQQAPNQDP
jgi:hypothetical protein